MQRHRLQTGPKARIFGLWRVFALSSIAAAALLLAAVPADAARTTKDGGGLFGIQPLAGVKTAATAIAPSPFAGSLDDSFQASAADNTLLYHGGPVVHGLETYAIFWDPDGAFAPATRALVAQYLSDVAAASGQFSNVFSVADQYTDNAGGAEYAQTFGGAFVDADAYPTSGNCSASTPSAQTCLYDSQEVSELQNFVASNGLPSGLGAEYFVLTPDTVITCIDGSTQCSTNAYCSFHSYAGSGASTLLYADIPFTLLNNASNAKSCQDDGNGAVETPNPATGFADVALKSMSHEEMETITDPLLDAWYSASGDEIGDECNGTFWNADSFLPLEGGNAAAGTSFNQTINGDHYYLQGAWSNETGGCSMMSALEPSISVTGATPAATDLSFSADAGTSTAVAPNGYVWDFGDGQTATGQIVTHSFAAAGDYQVTLTVTDGYGNTGSTTQTVDVGSLHSDLAAGGGKSANKASKRTTCGPVRTRDGTHTRVCTTTSISYAVRMRCHRASTKHDKHAARICRRVKLRITRRLRCDEINAGQAEIVSSRCTRVSTRSAVVKL